MPRQAQYDARAEVHVSQYLRAVVRVDHSPIERRATLQVNVIAYFGDVPLYRREFRSLRDAWVALVSGTCPGDDGSAEPAIRATGASYPLASAVEAALTQVWASDWPGAR